MVTVTGEALVWLLGSWLLLLRKAECRGKITLELLWVDRGVYNPTLHARLGSHTQIRVALIVLIMILLLSLDIYY